MKRSQRFIPFLVLTLLLGVFSLQLTSLLKSEEALYFGHRLSNPFQAKGDFYDPVKGHTGIDLATPEGTSLSISVPLRVVDIRQQNEMGTCLYTQDAWGNILVFAHLSEILPVQGALIKADEVFAKTGNTGTATKGPHLHFEILSQEPEVGYEIMTRRLGNYSGYNINPVDYLSVLAE